MRVRYESSQVYVEVNHGIQDCEVYLSFGRMGTDERFCFALFLKLINPALEKKLGARIAATPEMVATIATSLGMALQSEGKGIIRSDVDVFDRMKFVRWWHFSPEVLRES